MIRSEQAEGHKLITWKSGQNAYGSHSATLPSLSLHLWPQLTTGNIPGLQIGLHNMQGSSKSGQLQQYSPFLGYPSRTVVKKNSPTGQNFKMCISFTLLVKTNGQSWWQGNLEKRHLCMVKYLYPTWMFTKGWPQQIRILKIKWLGWLALQIPSPRLTASFLSHSGPHPMGSWTNYVWWQRWRSHLSSATQTSTHQGHTI